jgi:hypothetical protein
MMDRVTFEVRSEQGLEGVFTEHVLKARVAFIEDKAWDLLGLPRGEHKEEV